MKILESAENYLETILILKKQIGEIKAIDIVNYLSYSKPSVSNALKQLKENGFITINKSGYITLTKSGLEIANSVLDKHNLLIDFFTLIGVTEETALNDACKIEHNLSHESYCKIKQLHLKLKKESE